MVCRAVRGGGGACRRPCCRMQDKPCAVHTLRSRRRTRSLPCALFGYFRNRCSGPFFPNRRTGWARGRWGRQSPGVVAMYSGRLRSAPARRPSGDRAASGGQRGNPQRGLASSRARVLGQRAEERRQVIRRSFRRGSALCDCARNRLWGPPETLGKTRRKSLSG